MSPTRALLEDTRPLDRGDSGSEQGAVGGGCQAHVGFISVRGKCIHPIALHSSVVHRGRCRFWFVPPWQFKVLLGPVQWPRPGRTGAGHPDLPLALVTVLAAHKPGVAGEPRLRASVKANI